MVGLSVGGPGKTVVGNRIGNNPDGTVSIPNRDGISASFGTSPDGSGPPSVIGGTAPGAANIISGNSRHGIVVRGGFLITGNRIEANFGDGVHVELDSLAGAEHPLIGGTEPGAGNAIANNGGAGVRSGSELYNGLPFAEAAILGNRIFGNIGPGIDLGDKGVTGNDSPDNASSPANYPVLTSAVWGAGPGETGTRVRGSLDSTPSSRFRVEFFSSRRVDPSGYGEGETFLGALDVTTDAAGHAEIDADLPVTLTDDDYVTATATAVGTGTAGGRYVRTSEFSAAVPATAADVVPPRVEYLAVGGTQWGAAFKKAVAGAYHLPAGPRQLDVLSWINVDQIAVRFNRDAAVRSSDLIARGHDGTAYDYAGFVYNPDTNVATWTLHEPVAADSLVLELDDDAVRSGHGAQPLRLDGEWADAADAYPSGDGSAGGDFRFRFNVLGGDATQDGHVDSLDVAAVKRRLNRSISSPGTGASPYDLFHDVTADGRINALDVSAVQQRLNRRMPAAAGPAAQSKPLSGGAVTQEFFGSGPVL
jgi:hypothetical protein